MSRCDGSVSFISEKIELLPWQALGSRDGGELIRSDSL
jgi:hypothetical protein